MLFKEPALYHVEILKLKTAELQTKVVMLPFYWTLDKMCIEFIKRSLFLKLFNAMFLQEMPKICGQTTQIKNPLMSSEQKLSFFSNINHICVTIRAIIWISEELHRQNNQTATNIQHRLYVPLHFPYENTLMHQK